MDWYLYVVGAGCLILAFVLSRRGGGNSLRARDISGNTVVGNVSGGLHQGAPTPPSPPPAGEAKSPPDRIAWYIGIAGVLIATAQLVHDLLK